LVILSPDKWKLSLDSQSLYYADLINIGYEAPAGQMFSTTNDLAKLMKMLFRPEAMADPDRGQVNCW